MSEWAKRVWVLVLAAAIWTSPASRRFPSRDSARGDTQHPVENPIVRLNSDIQSGAMRLEFDSEHGYLPSVLKALNVPIESQVVVFSKGSLQGYRINPTNPRTLFFNDSLVVAWVWGGFLEFTVQDEDQGVSFYTLGQNQVDAAPFKRRKSACLSCHRSGFLGIPAMIAKSDHRTPIQNRWSGWYVTGKDVPAFHRGNRTILNPSNVLVNGEAPKLESLSAEFDTGKYLSPYSDVVALLVLDHQMEMMNLFTRMAREYRVASHLTEPVGSLLEDTAKELVDYMLFVDEAPLPEKIQGTSGFAERFSTQGPWDSHGRSLREFDLERRLMRYPCSYMIYSQAFDSLSDEAKELIYKRMWQILSGEDKDAKYTRLSLSDRQAIVEILRDTKSDLPAYFGRSSDRRRSAPGSRWSPQ